MPLHSTARCTCFPWHVNAFNVFTTCFLVLFSLQQCSLIGRPRNLTPQLCIGNCPWFAGAAGRAWETKNPFGNRWSSFVAYRAWSAVGVVQGCPYGIMQPWLHVGRILCDRFSCLQRTLPSIFCNTTSLEIWLVTWIRRASNQLHLILI